MKLKPTNAATAKLGLGTARDPLFGTSSNFPQLIEIDLAKISPRADQPRRRFDEDALQELAESIRRTGLLQPIIVRKQPGGAGQYEIVAGERRWRACGMAGQATIFAIVTTGDADELALIENIQRVDLQPLEEARAYRALMDRHGHSQDGLAALLGKDRSHVNSMLRLLDLPGEMLARIEECGATLSRAALIQIVRESDPEARRHMFDAALAGATERGLRALRKTKQPRPAPGPANPGSFFDEIGRIERLINPDRLPDIRRSLDDGKRARLTALRTWLDEILK